MEQVNYAKTEGLHLISEELYQRLDRLGLIPNEVRNSNVGKSDYAKHTIQPWSIWIDYELNPWDADIVKRTLRTKEEPGMSAIEARIMDYDKIEHICRERKRQLKVLKENLVIDDPCTFDTENFAVVSKDAAISTIAVPETPIINFSLFPKEYEAFKDFEDKHRNCNGHVRTCFSCETGIGPTVTVYCPDCKQEKNITDVSKW